MKLKMGKRSLKDILIGDYDYKFLCLVRTSAAMHAFNPEHNVK